MCDTEGRMTFLNAAFTIAVADDAGLAPADLWRSVVLREDREAWTRTFQAAASVRAPFRAEIRTGAGDARPRWLLLKGLPCSTTQKDRGYWGTAEDLSTGKWHAEAAKALEERYKVLADLDHRAVISVDRDLCVRAWNRSAADRSGIPPTTAIGRSLSSLPPPFGGPLVADAALASTRDDHQTSVRVPAVEGGEVALTAHPFGGGVVLVEDRPHIHREQPGDVRPASSGTAGLPAVIPPDVDDIVAIQDTGGSYVYFHAPVSWAIPPPDALGRKPHEIFPADVAERLGTRLHDVSTTGSPVEERTTIDWKGRRHWFHERWTPVHDAAGKVTGVVWVARDVTAQQKTEVLLRESEARYRSLIEHSLEGIWKFAAKRSLRTDLPPELQAAMLGELLVVEECNDAAARMYGFERREDLIGTPLARYLQPDSEERRHLLRSFVEAGYRAAGVEVRTLDRSGHVRYVVHTLVGTVTDGRLRHVWGGVAEITQRRLADREMRLLAQTITCAQDCVSITDLRDTILFVNDAFLRTYGYSEQDDLTGRNITEVRGIQDPAISEADIRTRTLAGGWNGEILNRRKDGGVFPVELWTSVVTGEDGSPVALVGVARDITERRRAEEQIRSSLHEKEVMLKEIHHRVKNNLQIVSSLLSLQSEYVRDPETLGFFRESQNRVKSMALVHEKLYQSSNLASVDFDGYLRELAMHLVRSAAPDLGRVNVQLDIRPVAMPIDKAIPCGIIVNELVTNALKYAFPDGKGGTLYVGCDLDPAGNVRLVVGDNGVGLPSTVEVEGTETLGLTLVQMLCDQLQARLIVHREARRLGEVSGVEFEVVFKAQNGHEHTGIAREG